MKTKLFFGLALILVLVVGAYVIFGTDTEVVPAEPLSTIDSEKPTIAKPQSGVLPLEDLLQRQETLECTITYRSDYSDSVVEGTLFTRDGRVRGDFVQSETELGQVVTSYVLNQNDLFVWSVIGEDTFGVRYEAQKASEATLPVSTTESVRYNCLPWTRIDDSIFELPSGVLFQEANENVIEYGTVYEEGEFPF